MSITKQDWVLPSPNVRVECGVAGVMRACSLPSRKPGFFCFLSIQVSLLANFSRIDGVISRSTREVAGTMSFDPEASRTQRTERSNDHQFCLQRGLQSSFGMAKPGWFDMRRRSVFPSNQISSQVCTAHQL